MPRRPAIASLFEFAGGQPQSVLPGSLRELALVVAHQRPGEAVLTFDKIKSETALGAEKVAVDAALVAIVGAHDLRPVIVLPHAQGHLAAVGAMRANGRDMVHLPGPGFIAIRAAGQRAHRADVDAHAALFAVETDGLRRWARSRS